MTRRPPRSTLVPDTTLFRSTSGTVTKNGTGAWTLSGANTYTGATTIGVGTLKLGEHSSVPPAPALVTRRPRLPVTAGPPLHLTTFSLPSPPHEALKSTATCP